jgi:cytochrome c553
MKKIALAAVLLAALPATADDLLPEARKVATMVPPKLLSVLTVEIEKGGPEGAIGVCREKAPEMAKAASQQTGWAIRRVSLKNRNPKAVPDAWERAILEDFDRRAAAGESPATLEKGEVVTEDGKKSYRYMKALPTVELCTKCHGAPEKLSPAVKAKLAELYPQDKAAGYAVGQIRGAMTIRKPL